MRRHDKHSNHLEHVMTTNNISEAAKAIVRRNTEEVQSGGNFKVFVTTQDDLDGSGKT
jgi:hypothetical protein